MEPAAPPTPPGSPPPGWGAPPPWTASPAWEPWGQGTGAWGSGPPPPGRPRGLRNPVVAALVGAVAGAGVTLAGLVGVGLLVALAFGDYEDEGWGFPEEVTYGEGAVAASAGPGDCFAAADLAGAEAGPTSCAEPHTTEVYARRVVVDAPRAAYPEDLGYYGSALCEAEFEPYVGRSYWDSELYFTVYVPERGAWDAGEREVVCAIEEWDESTTSGSAAGSGR